MEKIDLTNSKWFSDDLRLKPDHHRFMLSMERLNILNKEKKITFLDSIIDKNKLFFSYTKPHSTSNLNLTETCEEENYYQSLGCIRCGYCINILNRGKGYYTCDNCDEELDFTQEKRLIHDFIPEQKTEEDPVLDFIMIESLKDEETKLSTDIALYNLDKMLND